MSNKLTLYGILKKHGVESNKVLLNDLQALLTQENLAGYDNGERQGRSTQAILELQAQDRFISQLKARADEMQAKIFKSADAIKQAVEEYRSKR